MSEFDEAMTAIKQRFVDRCRTDRDQLRAHREGSPLAPETLQTIIHRMAGAAGIFGFMEVSTLAAVLDEDLAQGGDATRLPELIASLDATVQDYRG
jgi:HPt (histidine-containing phosphotransfer) domain-containing protein